MGKKSKIQIYIIVSFMLLGCRQKANNCDFERQQQIITSNYVNIKIISDKPRASNTLVMPVINGFETGLVCSEFDKVYKLYLDTSFCTKEFNEFNLKMCSNCNFIETEQKEYNFDNWNKGATYIIRIIDLKDDQIAIEISKCMNCYTEE